MYEYLEGRPALDRLPARLVLDVGGVGYDLAVPIGAAFGTGERVRVWTHLVVREDAHLLYGFPDRAMRNLFRLLLTVRGVGPGIALGVLSGVSRDELIAAIVADDAARLTSLKGVGKKTAEQILLDLRDKAPAWLAANELPAPEVPAENAEPVLDSMLQDAVSALMSVGYSAKEARKSVLKASQAASRDHAETDLSALVRAALRS